MSPIRVRATTVADGPGLGRAATSADLHQACGSRIVGVRERVGRHQSQDNRRRDVVFIERRSPQISQGATL